MPVGSFVPFEVDSRANTDEITNIAPATIASTSQRNHSGGSKTSNKPSLLSTNQDKNQIASVDNSNKTQPQAKGSLIKKIYATLNGGYAPEMAATGREKQNTGSPEEPGAVPPSTGTVMVL